MTTDLFEPPEAPAPLQNSLPPGRRACAGAAARRMGADETAARAFAADGSILVDGILLSITAAAGSGSGRWLATALLPRPEGVSPSRWSETLLLANGQALLVAPWIFGLEPGGDALLLMPLDPQLDDARTLAAHFDGMLSLCKAVAQGAAAMAESARPTEEPA
jgi:hypothetical protein